MSSKDDDDDNEMNKTLMSSKDDDDDDDDDDDETMNKKKQQYNKTIKWLFRRNNWQIKIIWKPNKIDKKSGKSKWVLFYHRLWQ